MKRGIIIILLIAAWLSDKAQNDTTITKTDTIQIGGMIIVNHKGPGRDTLYSDDNVHVRREHRRNSSSKDFVMDIGFANFDDHTNYTNATSQGYVVGRGSSQLSSSDFKLRNVKSSNVNLWFFMKRLSLVKHYINLKYGLGLEMNNYRFEKSISFREGGVNPYNPGQTISHPYAFMDSISFKKDKLSTDYITIPLMINFQSNSHYSSKGISASFGISAGYLYNSRNKQVSNERGKRHIKGDFGNENFKFSYIGELGLGKVRLYGSYSPRSIFTSGLDLRPYSFGIRFSSW